MYVNFQMTCYRSKPCCPTKVSEGVTILGVRWMIHGHLGVVLKRSYTENDTVLFTSFTHNTYMYKEWDLFYLPSTLQSNALSWRREPLSGTELPQAPNIEQLPFLCEFNEYRNSYQLLQTFHISKEEKMKLNSSIQTNLKPFKLMESMAQHFRFVFL